jgi:signal transduction histidine kinase
MQVRVAAAPFREIRRSFGLVARGAERPVLALVPLDRRLIHVVPRELVEHQQWRERSELVERRRERMDVMQDAPRDDCIERARIVELVERDPAIERSLWRLRVDRQHVVARTRECGRHTPFVPTANLQYAGGRRRKLAPGIRVEIHAVEHTEDVHRSPSGPDDAAERLKKLQAVNDAALAHFTLDDLLDELLTRIRDLLGTDTAAVLLLDETGNELVARAAKGIEEEVERGVRIPLGKGFAGRIAAGRKPVVLDDVDHADVLNPLLREKGIKSLLGVPLIAHDDVVGVLHVGTLTPRLFDEVDIELLEVVAQRVAVAIDRTLVHEEVVRLTQLQRDFIALAAHELRTPAATVYGLAATLARRELEPATELEIRETLYEQAERLRRLVEQLLDMSRLDAASIEVKPERLRLETELEEIVHLAAAEHLDDVVIETRPGEHVLADRAVLERVVANLVTNALQHGAPPIRLAAEQTDTHLRVTVTDSGEGIDPQFVPHLFDRFRRDVKQPAGSGAGLGLSIARAYARAHGGDLLYHPVAVGGAAFELVLPRTSVPPE